MITISRCVIHDPIKRQAVCFGARINGRIKGKKGVWDVTCNSLIATQESEGNWLSIGTKNIRQADQ